MIVKCSKQHNHCCCFCLFCHLTRRLSYSHFARVVSPSPVVSFVCTWGHYPEKWHTGHCILPNDGEVYRIWSRIKSSLIVESWSDLDYFAVVHFSPRSTTVSIVCLLLLHVNVWKHQHELCQCWTYQLLHNLLDSKMYHCLPQQRPRTIVVTMNSCYYYYYYYYYYHYYHYHYYYSGVISWCRWLESVWSVLVEHWQGI